MRWLAVCVSFGFSLIIAYFCLHSIILRILRNINGKAEIGGSFNDEI